MTSTEILQELREVLADELPTYAWSDTRALAYLNEGQRKFCELVGYFTDTHTFSVVTEVGVGVYPLDSRIIRVEEVLLEGVPLQKATYRHRPSTAERPQMWETFSTTRCLTLIPTPTTIITLPLVVWRYPLAAIRVTGVKVNPEIPESVSRACLEWAAYKCYGHHDVELTNSAAAQKHRAAFRQYVLDGRALKFNEDGATISVGPNPGYQV